MTKLKLSFTMLLMLAVLLFGGCGPGGNEQETKAQVNIISLKGPTGIGLAYMMGNPGQDYYRFDLTGATDTVASKLISGEVDIAAVPTNLAATLYARTKGAVQIVAVNTYGSLYILENGDSIHSFADLAGRTIYATGQGANPEYILNYLLKQNGLIPGTDVFIEYKSEHAELATLMASGDIVLGMLPEPNLTAALSQNSDLRVAIDLGAAWEDLDSGGALVMGCLVARKDFIEKYPAQLAAFLMEAEASINYALANLDAAAELCAEQGIIPSAAIAKQAIPRCRLVYIQGSQMRQLVAAYLQVLYDANPQAIGGALPDQGFYYSGE